MVKNRIIGRSSNGRVVCHGVEWRGGDGGGAGLPAVAKRHYVGPAGAIRKAQARPAQRRLRHQHQHPARTFEPVDLGRLDRRRKRPRLRSRAGVRGQFQGTRQPAPAFGRPCFAAVIRAGRHGLGRPRCRCPPQAGVDGEAHIGGGHQRPGGLEALRLRISPGAAVGLRLRGAYWTRTRRCSTNICAI